MKMIFGRRLAKKDFIFLLRTALPPIMMIVFLLYLYSLFIEFFSMLSISLFCVCSMIPLIALCIEIHDYIQLARRGYDDDTLISTDETATLLNITSVETKMSWLEGGYFPHAFKDACGVWKFKRGVVIRVRDELDRQRRTDVKDVELQVSDENPPAF